MSTVKPHEDINQWIEFCERLSPFQNYLLIGAISQSTYATLAIIQAQPIETQENWKASKKWDLKHMRKALRVYCEYSQKPKVVISAEVAKKSVELIKAFAPFLMLQLSVPLGVAVAFSFWALGFGLSKWCERYASKNLTGDGIYSGDIPQGEVHAFFDITYLPPIVEFIEDEKAYPLEIKKKQIRIPAETIGLVRVPNARDVQTITFSFNEKAKHQFIFRDAKTNEKVMGEVTKVYPKREVGANILGVTAGDLSFS